MFATWLLPNKDDTKYLEKLISNLSIKFNSPKFVPHITIHGLIEIDYTKIEKSIKNSIQRIEPFIVNKTSLKESTDIWKSLFIDIENNSELSLIHNRLSHAFGKFNKIEFCPHISLIYKNLNKIEKLKIIKELKIKNTFKIDKIAIQKFTMNIEKWQIVKIFNL